MGTPMNFVMRRAVRIPLMLLLFCSGCGHSQTAAPVATEFSQPQRVTIRGYDSDAMEPFLSRDGKYLFFNNLNEAPVNTDLFYAERIDDLTFQFKGPVGGVNTPALEGVASMDRDGNFYFISPRSYDRTASTIYRGRFANGAVTGVELVPGVSLAKPGIVNFDAEISAYGDTLYFVESQFDRHGHPRSAKILFARRVGDRFVRADDSERIMKTINTGVLDYAPSTSVSELELYFTRLKRWSVAIYVATRPDTSSPFGEPRRIEAAGGFVEGPTVSPDGKAIYFHKKEAGHLVLYRTTKP